MHLEDIIDLRDRLRNSIREGWITAYADEGELDEALRNLVGTILAGAVDEGSVEIFSEKSPTNVLVFGELLSLFPDAWFLFVVRDPRDVVASMLEVGDRGRREGRTMQPFTRDVVSAASFLQSCVESGLAARESEPDRVEIVRYEDLVSDPEGATRELCEWLELEWSAKMLRPGEKEHPGEDAIVDGVWYDEERFYSDPSEDRVGSWRDRLNPAEKVAVRRAFARWSPATELGYEPSEDGLGALTRLQGYARYGLSRALHRLAGGLQTLAAGLGGVSRRLTRFPRR